MFRILSATSFHSEYVVNVKSSNTVKSLEIYVKRLSFESFVSKERQTVELVLTVILTNHKRLSFLQLDWKLLPHNQPYVFFELENIPLANRKNLQRLSISSSRQAPFYYISKLHCYKVPIFFLHTLDQEYILLWLHQIAFHLKKINSETYLQILHRFPVLLTHRVFQNYW